jgi:hypothetical protein
MIVEQVARQFEISEPNAQSFNFGIDEEDMSVIAGFLEDKIYTDKVLAVVREISANAADAHVEAGTPEKPFLVQLPTDFEPHFKVIDYGLGLSEEKLRTVFTRYGKSTKRGSNGFVGCLGLGCKSPFAYANSFLVISRNGGRKFIYNATKDDKGINRLIKLSEEETTEPSGLEICVPVAAEDFDTFKRRALELYRWFKVKPEVHGITDAEKASLCPERTVVVPGNNWALYSEGRARAIMGNIGYELNAYSIDGLDYKEKTLFNLGVELEFDIGALDIVISREGLEYTEKTSKAIKERVAAVLSGIQGLVQEKFDNCATLWDAKCYFGEIYDQSTNHEFYKFRELVNKNFSWKGIEIKSDSLKCDDIDVHRVLRDYNYKVKLGERGQITARQNTLFVINDLNSYRGAKTRLGPVLAQHPGGVYLFTFKSETERETFVKDNHLQSVPFKNLSEYPYNKVVGGNGTFNTKYSAKTFVLNDSVSGYGRDKSVFWDEAEVDLQKGGVYVVLERFKASVFNNEYHGGDINSLISRIEKLGVSFDEVYGFKPSYVEKNPLPANWISLDKYIQDTLTKHFQASNLAEGYANSSELGKLPYDASKFAEFIKRKKIKLDSNGVASEFVEAYNLIKKNVNSMEELKSLVNRYQIQIPELKPSFDLCELWQKVLAKFSMLSLLDSGYFQSYRDDENKPLVDYITELDKI